MTPDDVELPLRSDDENEETGTSSSGYKEAGRVDDADVVVNFLLMMASSSIEMI